MEIEGLDELLKKIPDIKIESNKEISEKLEKEAKELYNKSETETNLEKKLALRNLAADKFKQAKQIKRLEE